MMGQGSRVYAWWGLGLLALSSLFSQSWGLMAPIPSPEENEGVSEEDLLGVEKPSRGFIEQDETHAVLIRIPRNHTEYPNILLTLTANNEEGNADLACFPSVAVVTQSYVGTHWISEHSEGKDYVFISRDSELYESAKRPIHLQNGETFNGVDITCGLTGKSYQGTDYLLEIDVDYTSRYLIEEEQSAMARIFDKCCRNGPALCLPWKSQLSTTNVVSMDFCHISGNICNADGRLIRLNLNGERLMCDFPVSEISQLSALEKLEMSNNNLKGNISGILSAFLDSLPKLSYINIARNALSGKLDADPVCELTHNDGMLTYLNLRDNSITGSLPDCLFDESSILKEFIMSRNNLEGTLPRISPNSMLQDLHVSGAGLSGTLDNSLARLEKLISLQLDNNKLDGTLPDGLGSNSLLASMSLAGNYLVGVIPGSLAISSSMRYLLLGENNLEGFAEEWYTGSFVHSQYAVVDLSHNSLEGEFPRALAEAPELLALHIEENYLTGSLPNKVGMFPRMLDFDVQGNHIEGEIPQQFANIAFFNSKVVGLLTKLLAPGSRISIQLDLSHNSLSGTLPEFLHADNVPGDVLDRVRLGGNNFKVPCPTPKIFGYLQELECRDVPDMVTLSGVTENLDAQDEDPIDENPLKIRSHTSSTGFSRFWFAMVCIVLSMVAVVVLLVTLFGMRRRRRLQLNTIVGDVELGET